MNAYRPLAAALALWLAACSTTPTSTECRIARMDVAAAEACLAEPNCAAKWDSAVFRAQLADNREYVAKHCGSRS